MGYKINKGFMWVREPNIPAEYQEVEYIENSGTQYIKTNLDINTGYRQVMKVRFLNTLAASSYPGLAGGYLGYSGGTYYRLYLNGLVSNNTFQVGFIGTHYDNQGSAVIGTDYEIDFSRLSGNMYLKINGTTIQTSSTTRSTSLAGKVCFLGSYAQDGSPQYKANPGMRLYYSKLYNSSGELVGDYVPCYRKSDNVIGLYDKVEGKFYTNSGSGTFTKGNDVSPTYVFKEKQFYPGTQPTPPTPPATEIYYDLRGGSINGLTAAGFNGVYNDGSYQFYSDGLGQTSGSNDRTTYVWTNQLDLSSATKVTIECLGYWMQGAWSNGKWLEIRNNFNGSSDTNPCFSGCINLNTDSPSYYSFNGFTYVNSSGSASNPAGSRYAASGGDTTMTQVRDLINKTWTLTYTGANSNSFSTTLSDAQVTEVKACKCAKFGWGRGYSSYNGERLKTVYIKIEY